MHDEVTEKDIERMKEEIEYRKLVVRKASIGAVKEARALAISVKILSTTQQKKIKANESRIRYLELHDQNSGSCIR